MVFNAAESESQQETDSGAGRVSSVHGVLAGFSLEEVTASFHCFSVVVLLFVFFFFPDFSMNCLIHIHPNPASRTRAHRLPLRAAPPPVFLFSFSRCSLSPPHLLSGGWGALSEGAVWGIQPAEALYIILFPGSPAKPLHDALTGQRRAGRNHQARLR